MRATPAVGLLMAVILLAAAPPAAAQTSGSARLIVTGLAGVLGPGSVPAAEPTEEGSAPSAPTGLAVELLVENDGREDLDDLQLVVEVFDRTRARSTLRAALDQDAGVTDKLLVRTMPLRPDAGLAPGDVAGMRVTAAQEEIGWAAAGGVYPLRLSVLEGSDTLDTVTTAVVYLAERPANPLLTTVVWPLDAPPWQEPDGTYPPGVDEPIAPGGRLDRLVTAAERESSGQVLLAPSPHLLEALADRADGFVETGPTGDRREIGADDPPARRAAQFLERIRELLADSRLDPLAAPYADVEIARLVEAPDPLPGAAGTAVAEGRRRLARLGGRLPEAAVALSWPQTTPRALDLLPGEHVLLRYDEIVGPDASVDSTVDLPPTLRTVRTASGRSVTASVADPYVARTVAAAADTLSPVAAVQRVLAEAAMEYFSFPETAGRPLLVLPPADYGPRLRVARRLLAGLSQAPWLALGSPLRAVTISPGAPPVATLAAEPDPLPEGLAGALVSARRRLDALAGATDDDVTFAGRTYGQLTDQLLRVPSMWFLDRGAAAATRHVTGVAEAVDAAVGTVAVPDAAQVTLTSETGRIPVTIRRPETPGAVPLDLRVRVASSGSLAWPDGQASDVITLEPGRSETISFTARALSTGTFPVIVTAADPTGLIEFPETELSVRSTAISGPALGITAAVVVVLLLAGLLRRRNGSGDRGAALEVVR